MNTLLNGEAEHARIDSQMYEMSSVHHFMNVSIHTCACTL